MHHTGFDDRYSSHDRYVALQDRIVHASVHVEWEELRAKP